MINRLKNPNPRKKTQIFDILRITHYDILRTLFRVGTFQCHTIVVISYRKFYFIWCNEMYGVCAPASMVIRVVVNIHHNSLFSYQNYVKSSSLNECCSCVILHSVALLLLSIAVHEFAVQYVRLQRESLRSLSRS